ncbi:MAG: site-2 protease family protein [Polyangiaceae bacterium]|nr:site-2 protease family protein [Polyangiaceae bacterium]
MFDSGWTIFRVRGIPVKLHVSLLLFLPFVAYVASSQFRYVGKVVGLPLDDLWLPTLAWGAILAVGLFVSILLHELAHSIVALRGGTPVRSITLMMLGGVSRMERDVKPEREAWMAFVGPLSSLGLGLFCGAMYLLPFPMEVRVAWLVLAMINVVLAAFNLLPAFPMDGGRVLRGLLTPRLGPHRATRVAVTVGKFMAVLFAFYGLLSFNVLLVLIAAFVYMGAMGEQARNELRHVLEGTMVLDVMTDRLGAARADEPAGDVARRLYRENQEGALVIDGRHNGFSGRDEQEDHVLGVVIASDLAKPELVKAPTVPVGAAMRKELPRVHTRDDAAAMLDTLMSGDVDAVLVLDDSEHIVGLVTQADIQRAMTFLGAMSRDQRTPPGSRPQR